MNNWLININGAIIDGEAELREQLPIELFESPENHEDLITDILTAASSTQPGETITHWLEREPGICSILAFEPPPATIIPQMLPSTEPLEVQLATIAATGLMSGFEDNLMTVTEGGFIIINDENPPEMEDVGEITRRVFGLGRVADSFSEFNKWQQGAWLYACENTYGENFSLSQWIEESEAVYNTAIACLSTYSAFASFRYMGLTYTHHKEAHFCKLGEAIDSGRPIMHRLLQISEKFQLSCADQRKLFSYVRNYGSEELLQDVLNDDEIDSMTQEQRDDHISRGDVFDRGTLIDRVTVSDANHNYLFTYNDSMHHYRGAVDALPAGASNIICTDDWKLVQRNGNRIPVPSWNPNITQVNED